jgi:hypothetical protein
MARFVGKTETEKTITLMFEGFDFFMDTDNGVRLNLGCESVADLTWDDWDVVNRAVIAMQRKRLEQREAVRKPITCKMCGVLATYADTDGNNFCQRHWAEIEMGKA